MLETVKNKIQRSGLFNLLVFIVDGTKSPAGYAFVPQLEVQKLVKAEPTFVVLDTSVTNNQGQIKATATQLAIDAVTAQTSSDQSAPAKNEVAKPEPIKYDIVTLEAIPPIMRGGSKGDSYPFDQLKPFPQPGHAFFVPATEARPNPAKALASTVASATKRHANTDKAVYTVRKVTGADGKVTGAHVIRTS